MGYSICCQAVEAVPGSGLFRLRLAEALARSDDVQGARQALDLGEELGRNKSDLEYAKDLRRKL